MSSDDQATTPCWRLEFQSKDQVLARYYAECFHDWFLREFLQLRGHFDTNEQVLDKLRGTWNTRMLCEAQIQEHYDFTINPETTRREVIHLQDGTPKLMIPTVVVHEGC